MKSLSDHTNLPCKSRISLLIKTINMEEISKLCSLDLLNVPYGQIPCISYTCWCFQFPKSWLCPNLPYYLHHRHVSQFLFFCKHISEVVPMLTEPHRQYSACFINVTSATFNGNIIRCNVASVVDFLLGWFS